VWGKALKEAFLILYGIAYVKDASLAAHLELSGGFNPQNVSFVRATHNWEVDFLLRFLAFCIKSE
jgi:hypothetical protein